MAQANQQLKPKTARASAGVSFFIILRFDSYALKSSRALFAAEALTLVIS
jgi:hypothetical protein